MYRQNKIETQDGFFHYAPNGQESSFIDIDTVIERTRVEGDDRKVLCKIHVSNVLAIQLIKDPATDTYERSVFSILDLFGNLGGLFEILQITGSLIVGYFSRDLLLYSILSKLYQVNQPNSVKIMPKTVLEKINIDAAVIEENIDNSGIGINPSLVASEVKVT
jgi:hypothetical protein